MEWLLEMDGRLLLWLKEFFAHPVLDDGMIFISRLGNKGFVWIAIGVVFLLLGFQNKIWRKRGLMVLLSLAGNFLACNVILKPLVNRTRPYVLLDYDILIPPVGDASFPSGISFPSAKAPAMPPLCRRQPRPAHLSGNAPPDTGGKNPSLPQKYKLRSPIFC